jgi:RNA polymerase sigma factor (sigma-70 family)
VDELKIINGVLKYMYGSVSAAYKVAINAHMTMDDLIQIGRIAIWKAEKKYIPKEGHNFESYAFSMIRFDLMKEIRRKGDMISIPHKQPYYENSKLVSSLNVSVGKEDEEQLLNVIPGETFNEENVLVRVMFEQRLKRLDKREKKIVIKTMNGMSQKEIGKEIGLSQVHVSRMLRGAIEKMKEEAV